MSFNGVNDHIRIPDSNLDIVDEMTIELWVKFGIQNSAPAYIVQGDGYNFQIDSEDLVCTLTGWDVTQEM